MTFLSSSERKEREGWRRTQKKEEHKIWLSGGISNQHTHHTPSYQHSAHAREQYIYFLSRGISIIWIALSHHPTARLVVLCALRFVFCVLCVV
jgi:hypothetical protein